MEGSRVSTWKEKTLIPSQGRVSSSLVLLLGMGSVKEYGTLMLRQLAPYLLSTLRGLQGSDICVSLPCGENYNVDAGKAAEVFIEAVADSLGHDASVVQEEWIMRLRLFFAEGEERLPEILFGIQTAQSIVEERLPFRILSPQEKEIMSAAAG